MNEVPQHPPVETVNDVHTEHPNSPAAQTNISSQFLKILGILIVSVGLLGAAAGYFKYRLQDLPGSYEDCVKRPGSRVQESFPATCITLEGNYFIQPITDQNGNPLMTPPPVNSVTVVPGETLLTPTTPNGYSHVPIQTCKRVGCSGELCVDINSEDIVTDCSYKLEYSCYQEAPCERQSDGQCGYTPSAGLTACLQNAK